MAFSSFSSLTTKAVFASLRSLVPVDLAFNILVCPPALIIPLGSNPTIKSSATLLKKDKVTTESQVTTKTAKLDEKLIVTQRAGQQYIIDTNVPISDFDLLSDINIGISSTGILQTMINIMYNQFETSSCLLISQFGVAGIDGNLYITQASITSKETKEHESLINLNLILSVQPPEKKEKGSTKLNPIDGATQKIIDGFYQ